MHRTLAAQLCGILVTVEKDTFESRLKEILPLLLKQFHADFNDNDEPGRFVKLHTEKEIQFKTERNIKDPEKMKDHHIFQVLQLLLKISANCTAFLKSEEYKDAVHSFAGRFNVLRYLMIVQYWQNFMDFRVYSIFVSTSSYVGAFSSVSTDRIYPSCSRYRQNCRPFRKSCEVRSGNELHVF